ncbi:MAG: hypothetical protein OT477_23350 [Chloroflexi bacterium]|nr:hypothetical protein [Chloroflexota bacterium]
MFTEPYREYFSKRIDIADNVFAQYPILGSEADAQIILCCAIGALSAMRWPGESGKDKKRFIELLIRFAPNTKQISIPLLVENLYKEKHDSIADILVKRYFGSLFDFNGVIDTGGEIEFGLLGDLNSHQIDQTENEIIKLLSVNHDFEQKTSKIIKLIRSSSYASIFYTDFRCGLIHTYSPNKRATSIGYFAKDRNSVIYTNLQDKDSGQPKRQIYFPYEYVRRITREAINNAFDDWDNWDEPTSYMNAEVWIEPDPKPWWIEDFSIAK